MRSLFACQGGAFVMCLYLASGCASPALTSHKCDEVRRLRLGMTGAEVVATIGQPVERIHGYNPKLEIDIDSMAYHVVAPPTARVFIRDTFRVDLHNGRVFSVSAYRTYRPDVILGPSKAGYVLSRNPLEPDGPVTQWEGPAFQSMFHCASSR